MAAVSNGTVPLADLSHRAVLPVGMQSLICAVYILGIVNNLGALGFLYGSEHAPKNARTSLLLKCLAFNDLFAILGMWIQLNLRILFPGISRKLAFCVSRTVWRSFGLGSGCIVCVMAVDRWLALTRPFFYQKGLCLHYCSSSEKYWQLGNIAAHPSPTSYVSSIYGIIFVSIIPVVGVLQDFLEDVEVYSTAT